MRDSTVGPSIERYGRRGMAIKHPSYETSITPTIIHTTTTLYQPHNFPCAEDLFRPRGHVPHIYIRIIWRYAVLRMRSLRSISTSPRIPGIPKNTASRSDRSLKGSGRTCYTVTLFHVLFVRLSRCLRDVFAPPGLPLGYSISGYRV